MLAEAYPRPGPERLQGPGLCLLLPHWRTVLPGPRGRTARVAGTPWPWPARSSCGTACRRPAGWPCGSGTTAPRRQNLAGIDTYVARYEDIVADPAGSVTAWADWLGSLDPFSPDRATWDVGRAAASIAPELRHQATRSGEDGRCPTLRRTAPTGRPTPRPRRGHRPFADVDPGEETPWATALLAARQDATRGALAGGGGPPAVLGHPGAVGRGSHRGLPGLGQGLGGRRRE